MRCRINLKSDPISLIIFAANGKDHQIFEEIGHDGLINVNIKNDMTITFKTKI